MTAEDDRAAAYRAQATVKKSWDAANAVILTGRVADKARVVAAWQPLVDWLREKRTYVTGRQDD